MRLTFIHCSLFSWIPPATSFSTICSICVQHYSRITLGWEGGFLLRSTLWQLLGVEVTCHKSKHFTSTVYIFICINFTKKFDWFVGDKKVFLKCRFDLKSSFGWFKNCKFVVRLLFDDDVQMPLSHHLSRPTQQPSSSCVNLQQPTNRQQGPYLCPSVHSNRRSTVRAIE